MGILETMIDIPAEHEKNVFGQFDIFAKKIERALHVTLIARNGKVKVLGEEKNVERAQQVLSQLTELSRRGNTIQEQNVDYALSLTMEDSAEDILTIDKDLICHTLQGKPIKPKTLGQKKYVDAIREKMITFGLGPAGSGKTYLAMAMAITALRNNEVNKIILTLAVVFAVILGLTVIANADEIQAINPSDVVTSNSTGNTNANANTNANSNSNSANNNTARNNTTTYNNTNANANTNTNLPKTGLTDYSVLFVVIGALAVIGIVAYKKANYYKDI